VSAVGSKRRIFSAPECVLAVQGRSGSTKVDHFGTNRKRLRISPSLWLWSCLAPFSRYGDLLAENCLFLLHFPYPSLIRRPRSLCSPSNFALKLTVKKLESWGYPPVKTAWS